MPSIKCSICIVNYNSGKLLEACLDSLVHYPPSCNYEVIVVDNNSVDGSEKTISRYQQIRLVQNSYNAGFAKANNQAFIASSGEYLFLLNADTEVKPNALDCLLACADNHPRAGLISARLINPDGSNQIGFNIRKLPGLSTAFTQLIMIDEVWPGNPLTRRYMGVDLDYEQLQEVEQPAASALLYRRAAWEEIGGFDPLFPNWYNDVDLCKRVREAGWQILYCPSAHIMHYGGMGGVSRTVTSVVIETYRSQRLYFLKHFGRWGYWYDSFLIMSGMLLRAAILRVSSKFQSLVNVSSKKHNDDSIRLAFEEVLIDTIRTWKSLSAVESAAREIK